jgi:hypothetical protein
MKMRAPIVLISVALMAFAPYAHAKVLNAQQHNNEVVEYMAGVDASPEELEALQGEGPAGEVVKFIISKGPVIVSGVQKTYKGVISYCKNNLYCIPQIGGGIGLYKDAKEALCSNTGVGCKK